MDDIDADPCLARPGPSGLKSLGNTTMFKRVGKKLGAPKQYQEIITCWIQDALFAGAEHPDLAFQVTCFFLERLRLEAADFEG